MRLVSVLSMPIHIGDRIAAQLAARLALDTARERVSRSDVERHLGRTDDLLVQLSAGVMNASGLDAGLPDLVDSAEKAILEKALQDNPGLSRAELAAKLRISERALYKKLRLYRITG